MRKFTLGADKYAGAFKMLEECSELSVVLAKLATVDGGEYWEGRDLNVELNEEVADVLAAITYYIDNTDKNSREFIHKRANGKRKLYDNWALIEREDI